MSHVRMVCTSYTPPVDRYYCCLSIGLIEIPMNTTVEVGQEAIFTCTYRVSESQPTNIFIRINFFNLPISTDNSMTLIYNADQITWVGTYSFNTTSAFPTVTSGYQCIVSMNRVTLATTEPVTLTVRCKFTT